MGEGRPRDRSARLFTARCSHIARPLPGQSQEVPIACGVLNDETAYARAPFGIWEEDGLLRLVLCNAAPIDVWAMKDILRAVHRFDPVGGAPVMVEQEELVRMTPEAKVFLARICHNDQRPVAFMAYDLPDRIQGEFFLRFHKPAFPFRVFAVQEDAQQWLARYSSGLRAVR